MWNARTERSSTSAQSVGPRPAHHWRLYSGERRIAQPHPGHDRRMGRPGLQINGIAPGYIHTEMTQALVDDNAFNSWILGRSPAGRWGRGRPVRARLLARLGRFQLRKRTNNLHRRRNDSGGLTWQQRATTTNSVAGPAVVVHGVGDLRMETFKHASPGPHEAVVDIAYGGICGSDLHYWLHGAAGESILRAPLVLGHEVVGTVVQAAADGSGPAAGTDVAVHPATPGGTGAVTRKPAQPLPRLHLPGQCRPRPAHPGCLQPVLRPARQDARTLPAGLVASAPPPSPNPPASPGTPFPRPATSTASGSW